MFGAPLWWTNSIRLWSFSRNKWMKLKWGKMEEAERLLAHSHSHGATALPKGWEKGNLLSLELDAECFVCNDGAIWLLHLIPTCVRQCLLAPKQNDPPRKGLGSCTHLVWGLVINLSSTRTTAVAIAMLKLGYLQIEKKWYRFTHTKRYRARSGFQVKWCKSGGTPTGLS